MLCMRAYRPEKGIIFIHTTGDSSTPLEKVPTWGGGGFLACPLIAYEPHIGHVPTHVLCALEVTGSAHCASLSPAARGVTALFPEQTCSQSAHPIFWTWRGAFMISDDAFFTFLDGHEVLQPTAALLAQHCLFAMQWIAFAINEGLDWASPIRDLQCAFVMTHLPFWDQGNRCFSHHPTAHLAAHWTAVALPALCMLFTLLLCFPPRRFLKSSLHWGYARLHLCSVWAGLLAPTHYVLLVLHQACRRLTFYMRYLSPFCWKQCDDSGAPPRAQPGTPLSNISAPGIVGVLPPIFPKHIMPHTCLPFPQPAQTERRWLAANSTPNGPLHFSTRARDQG